MPLAKDPKKRHIPQSETLAKTMLKSHAAARPSGSPSSLEFTGTDSRPPSYVGNSRVYLPQGKYRLLQQMGDRCGVKCSFRTKGPKEVWKVVAKRVIELNP